MGQSFFPGEIGIRVVIDGKMATYAVPKDRLSELAVGVKVPIKEPERVASWFWVQIKATTDDERGAVFTAERIKITQGET
jgi:hypothetical protein